MAAPKRPTHVVIQSGLYFGIDPDTGRPKELEVDSQLTLNKSQAEKLMKRGMVKSLKDAEAVDVSEAGSDAAKAELKTAKAELKTAKAELKASEADLKTANAEIVTLKAEVAKNAKG